MLRRVSHRLADQLAKNYGGNFGDDVDGLAALEKEFLKSVETTSLDPLKRWIGIPPFQLTPLPLPHDSSLRPSPCPMIPAYAPPPAP